MTREVFNEEIVRLISEMKALGDGCFVARCGCEREIIFYEGSLDIFYQKLIEPCRCGAKDRKLVLGTGASYEL